MITAIECAYQLHKSYNCAETSPNTSPPSGSQVLGKILAGDAETMADKGIDEFFN